MAKLAVLAKLTLAGKMVNKLTTLTPAGKLSLEIIESQKFKFEIF